MNKRNSPNIELPYTLKPAKSNEIVQEKVVKVKQKVRLIEFDFTGTQFLIEKRIGQVVHLRVIDVADIPLCLSTLQL